MLDPLGRVGGGVVGMAFAGLRLEAVDFAQGALRFALQGEALRPALGGEAMLAVGAVDVDPVESVTGLLGGDDEVGGEFGLDHVVRAEGGDPGDDAALAEGFGFVGIVRQGWKGAGEGADEIGVGFRGEAVGKVVGGDEEVGGVGHGGGM